MNGWVSARLKRWLDAALAAGALVVLSSPLVVLGILVAATSPGAAFYGAHRVGRGGHGFRMYKFRSMVANADQRGPLITAAGDLRVTRLGRWLRRTKLDELPALWNVLVGEMSLVGPRPENPCSVRLYSTEQRRLLSVRPGLTSLASIKYRNEEELLATGESLEAQYFSIMQDKLRLDLEYLDNASLLLDLRILAETLGAVLYVHHPCRA